MRGEHSPEPDTKKLPAADSERETRAFAARLMARGPPPSISTPITRVEGEYVRTWLARKDDGLLLELYRRASMCEHGSLTNTLR